MMDTSLDDIRARATNGQAIEYVIYPPFNDTDKYVSWEAVDPTWPCLILCGADKVDHWKKLFPSIRQGWNVPTVAFDVAVDFVKGKETKNRVAVAHIGDSVIIREDGLNIGVTINEGQS